ncbi:MAG: NAD(P)-binding protein [Desulfobacteraceae bacterium]|nr:NAD(P)-binding protein [Desulfobacteraceae bacterium]
MRVGIIGAGIAGLSAGYRLAQQGVHPVIFEKGSFSGGRMSSDRIDDFIIDRGAYTIPETHHHFLNLIKELGLSASLVETPGTSSTFVSGEEHKIKIGSPMDFFKYRLLNLKNKKDLIKLFLYAKSLGEKLNLNAPTQKTLALEKETVSDYLIKNYSKELLEKIAGPIFADLYLGIPEDNSKAVFLSAIRNLTHFKIFTLNTGMGVVAQKMQEGLDVRFNTAVLSIRENKQAGTYHVEVEGDPTIYEFDKIIFAVPLPLVVELFKDLPESLRNIIKKIHFTPSMVVAMGLKKPFDSHSFMNNFLREEIRTLATVVLDHFKGPGRIPKGKGLATAILTKNASEDLFHKTENKITKIVLDEMDSVWPSFSSNILFARVYRWPFGGVQFPPGTLAQQVSMREALDKLDKSVAFASDGLYRASMEVSLRTGFKASERIMAGIE